MLDLESTLKTAVAYIIGKDLGAKESEYLKRTIYRSGRKAGQNTNGSNYYKIDQLLWKADRILNDESQPFKHYREKHGTMPPWILIKGMTFGNIYTFFKLLKTEQKNSVIAMLYGIDRSLVTDNLKNLTTDLLYVCLKMRNRCAHSGRVYNYFSASATINYSPILHSKMNISNADYRAGYGKNGLSTIIPGLSLFDNKKPYHYALLGFQSALQSHLKKYPENEDFLRREMKFKEKAFEDLIK